MFTKNVKPAKRGRPPGPTAQGEATRRQLYEKAVELIAERGYDATTLRDVADRAGVSVGLLYRYFPSKQSVVMNLHRELSTEYAERASQMPRGPWRDRFLFALTTSLEVLKPHRRTLSALVSVLVGDAEEGLFAPGTAFARRHVEAVFHDAVVGANDAPRGAVAPALGRLLYLIHLAVILWWLLDRTAKQRATESLVALLGQILPAAALAFHLPKVRGFITSGDALFREALFDDTPVT